MPWREECDILFRKAAQDELAMNKLAGDREVANEIIGFHAQQAVEKLLKAVLMGRSILYRPTHDLAELIDLVRDNGIDTPDILKDAQRLTPFAVPFRYDDLPAEESDAFDRSWAAECVRKTRRWAEGLVLKDTE